VTWKERRTIANSVPCAEQISFLFVARGVEGGGGEYGVVWGRGEEKVLAGRDLLLMEFMRRKNTGPAAEKQR